MFSDAKRKLNEMMKTKFPDFSDSSFSQDLYIFGGAIRDAILGKEIEDLDLFMLTNSKKEIFDFIKKHNLEFKTNSFGNPKILYNGKNVDFCQIKNFSEVVFFNTDGLFYNFNKGKFVITKDFKDFLKTSKIKIVNTKEVHPNPERIIARKAKIENFANFVLQPQNIQTIKTEIKNANLFEMAPSQEHTF